MNIPNRHERCIHWVKQQAQVQSLHRRVELYRWLADICGHVQDAAALNRLADDLENADQRCREFAFQFRKSGTPP